MTRALTYDKSSSSVHIIELFADAVIVAVPSEHTVSDFASDEWDESLMVAKAA